MTESFRREGEYPQENSPAQHAPFGEDWQRGRDRLAHETGVGAAAPTPAAGDPPPPPYPPPPPPPPRG
ncbi:hypothetical protein ACFVZ8_19170, partial [Streptomyces sp. NPDC059558]